MESNQADGMDVVFLSGVRTPFGAFGGSLRDLSATQLGIIAAEGALARAALPADAVEHVVFGNVLQTSKDAIYLARHIGLGVNVPVEVPALAVNRLCGSGFQAVISGAMEIAMGQASVVLCGGTESMSQAPHAVRGTRWGGQRLGPAGTWYEDTLWEALTDPVAGCSMAETAENLAERYDVTREEADEFAARSQRLAHEAWQQGHYADEVVPVRLAGRKDEVLFERDEHMRPDTTTEALSRLKPYFRKEGTVTAGNASGIGDGAASLVIASGAYARANGLPAIGRLVSWGIAGVEPAFMGIGPAPAARIALARAGLQLSDVDLVEVNEAFSSQYCAVERELGLDRDRVNVSGGAIALTHPLGASGARITVHLLHELRRQGKRFGLGAACIGGGQGIAVVVEAS